MIRELSAVDIDLSSGKAVIKGVSQPGMLLVWAGFCGHCTRFKPVYSELDKKLGKGFQLMAIEDKKITSAKLNSALGVQGYPTILWIDGSGRISGSYNGDRSIKTLLDYICKFYHKCVLMNGM